MKGKKIFLPIALLSLILGVGVSTLTACGGGNGGQSSAQTQKRMFNYHFKDADQVMTDSGR